MRGSHSTSKAYTATLVLASLAAVVFAALWVREWAPKPARAVRKEKPVEAIEEAPARLTVTQRRAIDFASRFLEAQVVESEDEVFYKVKSISVTVVLNDAVKKVLSENRVKNKFELILRQHNIRLDEKADVWLSVAIEGLWDKVLSENDDIRLTYRSSMSLQEIVTVGRQGDFRRVVATTWEEGSYGFAGKAVAEKAIIDSVEEMAESFANKFLATRDKEAKKKIDR